MEEIFVIDVWSLIVVECTQQALARLSLTCRSAKRVTWSLAASIAFDGKQRRPFDNIVQFTSSRLREVTLMTLRECPVIIRHLADHCPSLRVFRTEYPVLETFSIIIPDLARIVDRLTTLVIARPRFDDEEIEQESLNKLRTNFSSLLKSLKHPENLTRLEICFAPAEPEPVVQLWCQLSATGDIQITKSRPVPITEIASATPLCRLLNLEYIRIPLNPAIPSSALLLREFRQLRTVDLGHFPWTMPIHHLETFFKSLLEALSRSKVQGNILSHGTRAIFAGHHAGGPTQQQMFDWLNKYGFVGPLSGTVVSMLLEHKLKSNSSSALFQLIDLLESNTRPKWLRLCVTYFRTSPSFGLL
eukprot:TRINITY_DN15406_c0_g1_i1.p1 TRINITY_DN15406_c0_g1~~TRINITY_DN15406_c0_g1_i1.p1  ORF type:complete len:359 (-),score=33.68 TRINITY_DN15406_c0_g1_i1:355-1431(-)